MPQATIKITSLKIILPLSADMLPRDLVPMDGPAGEPVIDLVMEGGLTARARINGKNFRKVVKQVTEHGDANVSVALQGTLKPPAAKGGPFVLEGAGFQAFVKTPKPAAPAAEPAGAAENGGAT